MRQLEELGAERIQDTLSALPENKPYSFFKLWLEPVKLLAICSIALLGAIIGILGPLSMSFLSMSAILCFLVLLCVLIYFFYK